MRTTILSRSEENACQGVERARGYLRLLERHGLAANPPVVAAIGNLVGSTDFESAISSADVVVESAPENLEFKQDLFARMDGIAKAHRGAVFEHFRAQHHRHCIEVRAG